MKGQPSSAVEPDTPVTELAARFHGSHERSCCVVDGEGRLAAPFAGLTPATALGRLRYWHLEDDGNPVHEAEGLVDKETGEVIAEALAETPDLEDESTTADELPEEDA